MTDLASLDATAQAALVRAGDASPLELVDAAIARIEKLDPELNAVIHHRFERARAEAAGELPDGPFRGVPILFKDLNCKLEGEPCHDGSAFLKAAGFTAGHTDTLARRFLAAGFVCVGRTNTPELGLVPTTEPLAYGPTHNPWQAGLTPGGSSGGAAAAVASGMVPVAHASDGGGSIRIPASCCGLVGLKPTRGRTSIGPARSEIASFLDVELCISRTVADTAAVLDAVAGPAPGDPTVAPRPRRPYAEDLGAAPGPLRIALVTDNPLGDTPIHPDCVAAAEDAARLLESLGHHIEGSWPAIDGAEALVAEFGVVWAAGCAHDLDEWSAEVGRPVTADDVEVLTWALAELGRGVNAAQYVSAVAHALDFARRIAQWWDESCDLMLTPTLGEPPVRHGTFDSTPDDPLAGFIRAAEFVPYTAQFNVSGQPAISLPLWWNDDGLPVGVQLVAPFGREDLLVAVAAQLEAARPWADRRPPLHA